nr:MAG TPA: hypothetical protein [Bacteriophage sp.]
MQNKSSESTFYFLTNRASASIIFYTTRHLTNFIPSFTHYL